MDWALPTQEKMKEPWRAYLDRFATAHSQELAALAWGLELEKLDPPEVLGIDLQPEPHFVSCPRPKIEELNRKVGGLLQEILGLLDGQDRDREVLILAIADGQVKLVNFQPEPGPAECFARETRDLETLMFDLERRLQEEVRAAAPAT